MGPELRAPAVAGRFYPADATQLRGDVARYLGEPEPEPVAALGAVVPHAGYVYSGKVAGATFRRLRIPERVIVLCPNHTGRGPRVSVSASTAWRLPGGDVPVDAPLVERILAGVSSASLDRRAHEREHAIEVELPFLVALRPDVKIVPIVLGGLDGEQAAAIGRELAEILGDDDVLVLASSDMSHYLPHETAAARDRLAIDRLLALDALGLFETCRAHDITMCGVLPATALLAYAGARAPDARAELVAYATSGDAFGDRASVVGYAGVIFQSF